MPRRPQTLIPSSRGTTSLGPDRVSSGGTWCFTARKPLFHRRGAPRPQERIGFRAARRGASPPANPYSIVAGHHALRAGQAYDRLNVVPRRRQTLCFSSPGTTALGPGRHMTGWLWCLAAGKPFVHHHRAPRQRLRAAPNGYTTVPARKIPSPSGHSAPRRQWRTKMNSGTL